MVKIMSGFDSFLGNEKLKARLLRDIRSGKLSHAYIIEGAKGSGKKTLSKLICAAVSCESDYPPCMECLNCDKIMRDQSPDVMMIEADKDRVQLGVDVIRRLREDAVFAANDLPYKFYIFPDADSMNPQAQNALLKILEEPPEGIMFLLLCVDAENLLPTIRSRAPLYRLELLDYKLIELRLLEEGGEAAELYKKDEKAFRAAVKLSGGSLGRAKELCNTTSASECLRLWNTADKFMSLLANKSGAADELEFYEYASKLANAKLSTPKQRAELFEIYSLLADASRDLIAAKLTNDFVPLFYHSPENAREIAERFPTAHIINLTDVFAEALDSLERNINLLLVQSSTALLAMSAYSKYR
jgi:DNA polymerase III gamma/tau subunit